MLSLDDLEDVKPEFRASILQNQLERSWSTGKSKPSTFLPGMLIIFLRFAARTQFLSFCVITNIPLGASRRGFPRLCVTAFNFTQPFLMNTLLNWIENPNSKKSDGYGLIGAYTLVFLGIAVKIRGFLSQEYMLMCCVTDIYWPACIQNVPGNCSCEGKSYDPYLFQSDAIGPQSI